MDTLGLVEVRSIAAGAELADRMVKAAEVELVGAAPSCRGRSVCRVAGARPAGDPAVAAARQSGRALSGAFVIAQISVQVLAALKKSFPAEKGDALAVLEYRTVAAGITAADAAVKRAAVRVLRLVTGQGINGKSYFVLGGDVASVTEAVDAATTAADAYLVEAVVIPRPDPQLVQALTSVVR